MPKKKTLSYSIVVFIPFLRNNFIRCNASSQMSHRIGLELILHSVDFPFKPFQVAGNTLANEVSTLKLPKCLKCFLFLISNSVKNLSEQTGFLSGQNFSLA